LNGTTTPVTVLFLWKTPATDKVHDGKILEQFSVNSNTEPDTFDAAEPILKPTEIQVQFSMQVSPEQWKQIAAILGVEENSPAPRSPLSISTMPPESRSQRPSVSSPALAVDLREAARLLNVCPRTVQREIDRGMLRALKLGRSWRVRLVEIDAYLRRLEEKSRVR
jgi:excisionase family DNA binding protein